MKVGIGQQCRNALRPRMLNYSGEQSGVKPNGLCPGKFSVPTISNKQTLIRRCIQTAEALVIDLRVRFGVAKLAGKHFNVE